MTGADKPLVAPAAACLLPLVRLRGLGASFRRHWKMAGLLGLLDSAIPFVCFSFALLSITTDRNIQGAANPTAERRGRKGYAEDAEEQPKG